MSQHPNSRANLKPVQKGQVLNPKGVNGWTKLRERARESIEGDLESLLRKAHELAMDGEVQALALLLKPVLNVQQLQHSDSEGNPLDFAALAKEARESKSD